MQGDAEDLPFDTDSFDRYVSAGSIGGQCWALWQAGGRCSCCCTPPHVTSRRQPLTLGDRPSAVVLPQSTGQSLSAASARRTVC